MDLIRLTKKELDHHAKRTGPSGVYAKLSPGFFFILQEIRMELDKYEGSINIINIIKKKNVISQCIRIISRIGNTYSVDYHVLNDFINFIDINDDIFPPEYFEVLHTKAGETCLKCNLKGYDNFSKPFQMYHHNKTVDIRLNEKNYNIVIKCNIIDGIWYNKQFDFDVKPSANAYIGRDNVSRLIDIIVNIMMLCSFCFIRGDYNAIKKCFIPL